MKMAYHLCPCGAMFTLATMQRYQTGWRVVDDGRRCQHQHATDGVDEWIDAVRITIGTVVTYGCDVSSGGVLIGDLVKYLRNRASMKAGEAGEAERARPAPTIGDVRAEAAMAAQEPVSPSIFVPTGVHHVPSTIRVDENGVATADLRHRVREDTNNWGSSAGFREALANADASMANMIAATRAMEDDADPRPAVTEAKQEPSPLNLADALRDPDAAIVNMIAGNIVSSTSVEPSPVEPDPDMERVRLYYEAMRRNTPTHGNTWAGLTPAQRRWWFADHNAADAVGAAIFGVEADAILAAYRRDCPEACGWYDQPVTFRAQFVAKYFDAIEKAASDPVGEAALARNNAGQQTESRAYSHYFKPCPYSHIDIYRLIDLFKITDPCIQHALKKLLCPGARGAKDANKDVREAIASLQRYLEMRAEEAEAWQ